MAKAAEVVTDPEEPFAAAAARIVRVRAQELLDHSDRVLEIDDIEHVHDMRVASRRLRAVLEIFAVCFPAKRHRKVLRDVKALADALGERRDPDVHIEAMKDFPGAGPERLVLALRTRQAQGNEVLADALHRARQRRLYERLIELAEAAEARV